MMIPQIISAIRAKWGGHYLSVPEPKRLIIEKTKWFHGKDSPVLLMIDDLTNAWTKKQGKNMDGPDYDWGGKHDAPNSAYTFLKENLYDHFPYVKTAYFTIVGEMYSFNNQSAFASAKAIDADEESMAFFRLIGFSDVAEIAYHGLHHGIPREDSESYMQEWESFQSLEEALVVIESGKEIYKRVLGVDPNGGKCGGYKTNHLSEKTITSAHFLWWCHEWTPRDTTGKIPDPYYEVKYLGEKRKTVSIPSTLHGRKWTKKQVDVLLNKGQVITIQEHIAPHRPDGRIQTPNIYDDISSLKQLFVYLRRKNVWYATGSEIAKYFIGYSNTLFYDVQEDSFKIEYTGWIEAPIVSVIITADCICDDDLPNIKITLPGGNVLSGIHIFHLNRRHQFIVDLPVKSGQYRLEPIKKSSYHLKATVDHNGHIQFNFPQMTGKVEVPVMFSPFSPLILIGPYGRCDFSINGRGNLVFYCQDSSKSYKLILLDEFLKSNS